MVMNAKQLPRPNEGLADRVSTEKSIRMGMTSAGDFHAPVSKKLKTGKQGVSVNGCRKSDSGSKSSSQSKGKHESETPQSDKKKKENEMKSQKKKAEVQRTALRVCGEWSEHFSSSGKLYYYNCRTEVSRWEKPEGWIDMSEDNISQSKDAKKKQKSQLTKKNNSHSTNGPNNSQNSSKPVFPVSAFPSPTSRSAFHLRSPKNQSTSSTVPNGDMSHRTFPTWQQTSGNSFPNVGNFMDSVQSSIRPWKGSGGFCDSALVDFYGRVRLRSASGDEEVHEERNVETYNGAMYEDMDISPEGSPTINNRIAMEGIWTNGCRSLPEASENHPSMLPSQSRLSSQASMASLSSNGDPKTVNVTVANALAVLKDAVLQTSAGESTIASESFLRRDCATFDRSVVLALDSVGQLIDEPTASVNQMLLRQTVETLKKLETRLTHPHHRSRLQWLITQLMQIQDASQNRSAMSPTLTKSSDPRLTVTAGTIQSSCSAETGEANQKSSMHVETAPEAFNHSSDNDLKKIQESLGDSNVDEIVAANMPCPTTASCTASFTLLMPTIANYVNNQLTQHVRDWPSDIVERQADAAADNAQLLGGLHCTRVVVELKNLRSLIRANEITMTLAEQRALFLQQQIQDLEKGHAQYMSSYDI